MTSQIRSHIEYLIQTYYCAHFIVKYDEKFNLNDCFEYDLMMILDSGLLFWATLYMLAHIWFTTVPIYRVATFPLEIDWSGNSKTFWGNCSGKQESGNIDGCFLVREN